LWARSFPNQALDMKRLQDRIDSNYADDQRLAWLLMATSLLVGGISAIGVYVLSAYGIQRRFKEIAVRKLYGAGAPAIARLVWREPLFIVIGSALIGLPIAAVSTHRYLADFVESGAVLVPALVGAFALAALVAVISTAGSTVSALRVAPGRALQE
jgi:putative ABC transport system permease protein